MESQPKPPALDYDHFLDIIKRRRSVRRFEKGKKVERETLMKIAEAGRWAPTGANAQCWDLVIVDEPETRQGVLDVFLRQSQRLVDHAKGFPAVKKTYLANTVAIFVVLGDARFKACFPQATTAEWSREYEANNERIFLASLGAARLSAIAHRDRHDSDRLSGKGRQPALSAAARADCALEPV